MKLEDIDIGKIIDKFIPIIGSMTPEQKQDFVIKLAEAISRGIAEGTVRGTKCDRSQQ